MSLKDQRYVCGARCTWHDSIDKVERHPTGLPACPHCKGMLYEFENEQEWLRRVIEYQTQAGDDDYSAVMAFGRGRCFASFEALRRAFFVDSELRKSQCKVCGRYAPLVDGECPDCRH